jgi:hypothetical protein
VLLTACSRSEPPAALFDYQRLDQSGKPYTGSGDFARQPWACVHDRNTGLTWEVKTIAAGLHGRGNTYRWTENPRDAEEHYQPREDNPLDTAPLTAPVCDGSPCDTYSFVKAVNAAGWCGYHDWRMPSRDELTTLNDPRIKHPGPTMDTANFPGTLPTEYWTGTTYPFQVDGAWAWGFDYGIDRVDWTHQPKHARLVRGSLLPDKAPAQK